MYINPILVGILATIGAEIILFAAFLIVQYFRRRR